METEGSMGTDTAPQDYWHTQYDEKITHGTYSVGELEWQCSSW